jgi:uncharacterized protein (TIGR03067 family)
VASSTLKAAGLYAAGQPAATGPVSAAVAALTEGVLKAMFLGKVKTVAAVSVLFLALAGLAALAVFPLLGGRATAQPAVPGELQRFIGTWHVETTTVNGRALPKAETSQNDQMVYDRDGGWQQRSEGQTISSGVIVAVDTAAHYKAIDYKVVKGASTGKTVRAIYEFVDDDTYRICYPAPDRDRPADFSCKEGSGQTVCLLKRVKERPKEAAREEKKLWAGISVNQPVFQEGRDVNLLQFNFTLVNDGDKVVDPKIPGYPRLIVNGKELDLSNRPGTGPRDGRFAALPPGDYLLFGLGLGDDFNKAGVYRVYWQGEDFRSPEIVFRVMPKK